MNDPDQQPTDLANDEEVQIVDLDHSDASVHRRATRIIGLVRKSLATSWIRSGLSALLLLVLLGALFLQSPRPTPASSPTATPGLPPVTTPLAPPPQKRAITPPPQILHLDDFAGNLNVQLLGGGTFWIYGSFYQQVFHLSHIPNNEQWPMIKLVVAIGPNSSQPVTLRLRNTETNDLVWWTDGQTPPGSATQQLLLDPKTPKSQNDAIPGGPDLTTGSSQTQWAAWSLFPVFYATGCYQLQVSWSAGSWESLFAVGK